MDFAGTERFHILRRLGSGGMGVVYEAFDTQRGERVALKTLRDPDSLAVHRLKREFRAMADVSHPNLISLHELVCEGDHWFFTMELVEGPDLLSALRPEVLSPPAVTRASGDDTLPPASSAERLALPPPDWAHVRTLLGQLAAGVQAVHLAGFLHRDLKPSNVLVTREGRVVLLDFGLAMDLEEGTRRSEAHTLVGTAAYMAPEQAALGSLSPAADWYALGALLYEVLTGRPPFLGAPLQVLVAKQQVEPPPPLELLPGLPADLNQLCVELLRLEPSRRPSGTLVLERLRQAASPAPRPIARARTSDFVGRREQLDTLGRLMATTREGGATVALVHGRSGMGKSTLVRAFAAELAPGTVLLSGRCYERESMPFKALDSVVEDLASHLARMERSEVQALVPRDAAALIRIFPALRRVGPLAEAPTRPADGADLQLIRRRAFGALRELLARMADRHPLVLAIDDLQWGDADSASLLAEVLRPPDPPALLLLVCFREEELVAATAFRALLEGSGVGWHEVPLGPLSPEESRSLAQRLLGEGQGGAAEVLARESSGNPFFLEVLGRHSGARSEAGGTLRVTLEEVLAEDIAALPDGARALLELVAVAGRPLVPSVAARALGLEGTGAEALAKTLRTARLVRSVGVEQAPALEPYHDRIRQTALALLSPAQLSAHHLALAAAYEEGQGSPEVLSEHLVAAGEPERARRFILEAADRALQGLAFDRASVLLARYLTLAPPTREVQVRLADALANAGRGREAARAYLEAAALASPAPASPATRQQLQRRAAEQLLRTGHVDEGLDVLGQVLGALGERLDRSPRAALRRLLWGRAVLAMRGLEAQAGPQSEEALSRIDVYWSLAMGLAMVDTIRGASFQTQHLRVALRDAEPYRLCRALTADAAYLATAGVRKQRRAEALIARARPLALASGRPDAQGLLQMASGIVCFMAGQWRRALDESDRAWHLLEEAGIGSTWEAKNAHLFSLWSLFYLGDLAELSRRLPALRREAADRGDLYAMTGLRTGLAVVAHLCADRVHTAREEIVAGMERWSRQQFHFQHYWELLGTAFCALYAGEGGTALGYLEEAWPALARSQLLRIQNVRVEAGFLKAQCALAASGVRRTHRERLRRLALSEARRLEREGVAWARALALLVRAGALGGADPEQAATLYARAEEACRGADMGHYATAARRRRGELVQGPVGERLVEEADAWFRAQGIRSPERMTSLLAARAP